MQLSLINSRINRDTLFVDINFKSLSFIIGFMDNFSYLWRRLSSSNLGVSVGYSVQFLFLSSSKSEKE